MTQSPQTGVSPASTAEPVSAANELLENARSIRDQLAQESLDSNHKLSEAILSVIMYTERVETTARLLSLAETCVGKIRARMRAHGIPIQLPSSEVTPAPDVSGAVNRGQSQHSSPRLLHSNWLLDEPAGPCE